MNLYRRRCEPWKKDKAKLMRNNPTNAERLLWQQLRCKRMGVKFRRQAIILGYIVDFYCPSKKLIIEADGPIHDSNQSYDNKRDNHLKGLGLRIIRISNESIENDMAQTIIKLKKMI